MDKLYLVNYDNGKLVFIYKTDRIIGSGYFKSDRIIKVFSHEGPYPINYVESNELFFLTLSAENITEIKDKYTNILYN